MNNQCNNKVPICCGLVIKKMRKQSGMTGAELAKKLNISQQQMSRYERGINKMSVDMLFNLSIALNVSFEKIIKQVVVEVKLMSVSKTAMNNA